MSVEVVVAPKHLAGAMVEGVERRDDGSVWFSLDNGRPDDGQVKPLVPKTDVGIEVMSPGMLDIYRGLLAKAREGEECRDALGYIRKVCESAGVAGEYDHPSEDPSDPTPIRVSRSTLEMVRAVLEARLARQIVADMVLREMADFTLSDVPAALTPEEAEVFGRKLIDRIERRALQVAQYHSPEIDPEVGTIPTLAELGVTDACPQV